MKIESQERNMIKMEESLKNEVSQKEDLMDKYERLKAENKTICSSYDVLIKLKDKKIEELKSSASNFGMSSKDIIECIIKDLISELIINN